MLLVIYKGAAMRLSADFSTGTLEATKDWHKIFKVMKGKDLQTRLFYPARLSFKIEGEIDPAKMEAKVETLHSLTQPKEG